MAGKTTAPAATKAASGKAASGKSAAATKGTKKTAPTTVAPTPAVARKTVDVDFAMLRQVAVDAMRNAYVPYSEFPVGVAGLVDDGRVVSGCNVENASYGLTLCAECGMVSELCRTGGGRLVAVSCVDRAGEPLTPCGRCRQLLHEHGGPECLVETADGHTTVGELLPGAFGPEYLG